MSASDHKDKRNLLEGALSSKSASRALVIDKAYLHFESQRKPTLDIEQITLEWNNIAALMAPSGAGKTSLFRLLAGWFTLTEPTVWEFTSNFDPLAEVEYIGSHQQLLPWASIQKNAKLITPQVDKRKIMNDLDIVGLNPHQIFGQYPYELSLGMYKRVELVLAVNRNPYLLLLDEFFSSIDIPTREQVVQFILHSRGIRKTLLTKHGEDISSDVISATFHLDIFGSTVKGIAKK